MALRYTVLCNGEPVGVVDLSAPDDGLAAGLLEPLPAFARVGPALERGRRLGEEADMRMLKAQLEGRLPRPTPPPTASGEAYVEVRTMTPEEGAIFGDEALEAVAAAGALHFSLQDATGKPVPGAEVQFWPFGWPGKGGPDRPELDVFVPAWRQPRSDDE
jgi:hypothetical protein